MSDTWIKVAGTLTGVAIAVSAGVLLEAPQVMAAAVVAPLPLLVFELGWRQAEEADNE
ncbi:hypothetical protein AFNJKBDN_CDS0016 [Halorubrum virus V_ICIS4]|nr:hypothetical protein AFNJKBDN_CDS0016 [Halorubrum virus V_ICIS4]